MKRRNMSNVMMGLVAALFSCASYAELAMIQGQVNVIEPTYMPGRVHFTLTTGADVCPAGKWLRWEFPNNNNDYAGNKAAYAGLLTALSANKTVRFFFEKGDGNCNGKFLHIVK